LERISKEYGLEINTGKTVKLKLLTNGGENTVVKMNRKEADVDKFVCSGSVVEKNVVPKMIQERTERLQNFIL
jgi:hypothetical protein